MANVDVSELMHDPDFIDPIQVVSRKSAINSFGVNILTETCMDTYGSVQPAAGNVLQRLPEALRLGSVSSFWFKGVIIASEPGGVYSDILVFKGKRYQVQTVLDWSNFGEGYSEGTCVAERPS